MTTKMTIRILGVGGLVVAGGVIGLFMLSTSRHAATAPEMQSEPPPAVTAPAHEQVARLDGGKPNRDERWASRMDRVHQRARTELSIDETQSAKLLDMQTDLRAYKQEVRRDVHDGKLSEQDGTKKIGLRVRSHRAQVIRIVGPERANRYLDLVKEERRAEPVPM